MGYERFFLLQIIQIFLVLNPFLPGSRSVSKFGSITNFFKPWIRICIKMICIRHTAVHNSVSDLDPHPRFLWIQIPGWEDKTNL